MRVRERVCVCESEEEEDRFASVCSFRNTQLCVDNKCGTPHTHTFVLCCAVWLSGLPNSIDFHVCIIFAFFICLVPRLSLSLI